MKRYENSSLSKIVRGPKRANYDIDAVHAVLDSHFLCHVGYIHDGVAISIPTAYGRNGETILLHGAIKNRMLLSILAMSKVSLTVTHMDGLVLARSVFHHSFNYRSVTVFGKPRKIENDDEKMTALEIITENIIHGRWKEARIPNEKELKATLVVAVDIQEAALKERSGGPVDEAEDYALDIWAGEVPIRTQAGYPISDPNSPKELKMPKSALDFKF